MDWEYFVIAFVVFAGVLWFSRIGRRHDAPPVRMTSRIEINDPEVYLALDGPCVGELILVADAVPTEGGDVHLLTQGYIVRMSRWAPYFERGSEYRLQRMRRSDAEAYQKKMFSH